MKRGRPFGEDKKEKDNLRYADDATLVSESEEELKSLLMEEESKKADLKPNIQKIKIMALVPSLHGK